MKWIKHQSNSHLDEILSELLDEFGAEGYGVWWLILEKIAQLMDESSRTFARFSLENWKNHTKLTQKRFKTITEFLEKKERIALKYEGKYLTIDCPNLLKYRDEWTERKAKAEEKKHEQLSSNSRENSRVSRDKLPAEQNRTDTDTDTDKEEIYANAQNYFDIFWQAYRLHKDKARTFKIFNRINPDADLLQQMLDAIENQNTEKIYQQRHTGWAADWKHPATWLNGKNWNDEVNLDENYWRNKTNKRDGKKPIESLVEKSRRERAERRGEITPNRFSGFTIEHDALTDKGG